MQSQNLMKGQFGVESDTGYAGRHALVPILIGLVAPVLVLMFIDPRALGSASVLLHIYMFAIFVIATGAYIWTVLDPGNITRVTFDKQARKVFAERKGLLAKSVLEIPFVDIAAIRMENRYDDDGYESAMPVLALTTREVGPLPAGTTEGDLAMMRALMKSG